MKTAFALLVVLAACGSSSPPPTPPPGEPGGAQTCMKTGCGGTICAGEQMMSTCQWKPEHECYKTATCEWQAEGGCGWRETPELQACMVAPPSGPEGSAEPGSSPVIQ